MSCVIAITIMDPTFPPISKALMEALELVYPDRCPDSNKTDKDVHLKMGNMEVVRFLRRHYNDQNRTILS